VPKRREDAIWTFLRCEANGVAVPRWVAAAVAPLLRAELRKLEKRAKEKKSRKTNRQFSKMLTRWATYTWFRIHERTRPEALALSAQALGESESTVEHGYKECRNWFGLPPGAHAWPPQVGAENVGLTDVGEVPDDVFLLARLDTYVWFKKHDCTRDEALLLTQQVLGTSSSRVPKETILANILQKHKKPPRAAQDR
jgi:hypothetical protein